MTIKHIFHILYTFKTTKQLVDERIAKLVEENLEVIVWREMKIKHFFFQNILYKKKEINQQIIEKQNKCWYKYFLFKKSNCTKNRRKWRKDKKL